MVHQPSTKRLVVYPYALRSGSARDLARAFQSICVRPNGTYRPSGRDIIINWGNSTVPNWYTPTYSDHLLNLPMRVAQAADKLESGNILLFPDLSFELLPEETKFLTKNAVVLSRKNISFDWRDNKTKGDTYQGEEHQQMQCLLGRFSEYAKTLIDNLFPQYKHFFFI